MVNHSKLQLALWQMEHQNQMIIAMTYKLLQIKKLKNKRKHRWWVHSIITNRIQQGAYHNLVSELTLHDDGKKFKEYFRLTREQFAEVLFYVKEDLVKHCMSREVICPRQRLAICVR